MKIVIPLILALLLGAAGYMLFEQQKTDQRFKDLKAGVDLRRQLDSLRTVTETRIIDSLSADLSRREKRIDALEKELHKTQKQNAELEKSFRAIRVFMPEF
jgi:Uncharacterized enzyme of heme biosynthesis